MQDDYADCWNGPEEAFQSEQARTDRNPMKLASLKHGRDGRLVVVSRDLTRAADAVRGGADLARRARRLGRGRAAAAGDRRLRSKPAASRTCRSIRRSARRRCRARFGWADGSAYVNHVALVRKRARRRGAGVVLDRSADVSRRLRRVHRPVRSDPRRRHRLGRRSRGRGRGDRRPTCRRARRREQAAPRSGCSCCSTTSASAI